MSVPNGEERLLVLYGLVPSPNIGAKANNQIYTAMRMCITTLVRPHQDRSLIDSTKDLTSTYTGTVMVMEADWK